MENKDCLAKRLLGTEFSLRSVFWMCPYACKMPVLLWFPCFYLVSPALAGGFNRAPHMDGVAPFWTWKENAEPGTYPEVLPVEPRKAGRLCLRMSFS